LLVAAPATCDARDPRLNFTITLDDDKKGIADFCEKVGITISGLYNVFTKQVLREGRIPFEISINRPNRKTIKALEESDEIYAKYQKNPSKMKTYTVNEAIREMKSW
jgi:DNA-damage-inducible protein J